MFIRSDIRRLSFILIAQQMGFSLEEIRAQLRQLPLERTPNKRDWEKISRGFRAQLDARIGMLERLRDRLDGCIGCGCLSLETCKLYNPDDRARETGTGPRLVVQKSVIG
ncbi:redox-sensitive transcriptional activator SoxR [Hoeflea alexandrii]|nr:redox-sensitive transcriptional activator SoxR [Hoeflea alexandrii]MCY0154500.1 redox-sensitive transcriptional activator SoxR [Hoeflea alexandrii]